MQVTANSILKIFGAGDAAKGVLVLWLHRAGEVWYLRLPCYICLSAWHILTDSHTPVSPLTRPNYYRINQMVAGAWTTEY